MSMETRKEKYELYRAGIMSSSSLKDLRNRVIEENEENKKNKVKTKKKETNNLYSIYMKKRRVKIIIFSFLCVALIAIIIVGIYLGVKLL